MVRMRRPRLRWWGWLGVAGGLLLLYLIALSVIPAVLNRDTPRADPARARRAITAENWSLVVPSERTALGMAIDQAWRALRAYHMEYRAGTDAELTADTPRVRSSSQFNLQTDGRIASQRDSNYMSADAPGSSGSEQRFEGYRVLTKRPYLNAKQQRVGDAELIYQQTGGVWICQIALADKGPIPAPALNLAEAGDEGLRELDGRRVRVLRLPSGAFGLRSPAVVWIDTETLLIRRQEIDSLVRGQREVWTYSGFNEATTLTPPSGVTCTQD